MIQIILLIVGIVYATRRPKIKALTISQFPGVPPEVFAEWQALELKSIDMFLWATWGLLLIGTPLMFVLAQVFPGGFPGGLLGLQLLYMILWIVLLVFSAIPGSKAAKLKKQMQIEINKRHEQRESPTRCPKCNSGPIEIYERSREGEGWICRACNHRWLVSAVGGGLL